MTKKRSNAGRASKEYGKGRLLVVCSEGTRQRFLRGMITHHLVQRGLPFEEAYAIARAIRDRLSDREEVATSELRDLVQEQLEARFGGSVPENLLVTPNPLPRIEVLQDGRRQPFSRGLLARSVQAAGLDLDRAYRVATDVQTALIEEGIHRISRRDLAMRAGDLLEELEGSDCAQRYRLVRRIHRLPKPLAIYIGGASGTGKSTLALDLAPLFRIYRVNATDTIRQVMRMLFSPQILPALHSSSFEIAPVFGSAVAEELAGIHEPGSAERLIAAFEEQATRVLVGVRAVVDRAIAENMSVLVEGVHLFPGMVPFADLEGAAYQIPLVLGTLNEETHRTRFLARARLGGRRAERYLESFGAIRTIHDHLLQGAEAYDVPLIDTSAGGSTARQALRLITSVLQERLPNLSRAQGDDADDPAVPPTLLLIIDGVADRPVRALGGRTPLQAAETPTLDRLAKEGRCGLADPIAPGVVPDTAAGCLALFGQSPRAMRRGPVEAVGAEMTPTPGDIALRANLATLDDDGVVVDRRAGRIREGAEALAAALNRMPLPGDLGDSVDIQVRAATEHRLAIVLQGEGLSSAVRGSDPGDGALGSQPLTPEPVDPHDEAAVETARILAIFEQEARRVLAKHKVNKRRRKDGLPQVNTLLTRGAGRIHELVPIEHAGKPLRTTAISGDRTVLGLARWLGASTISTKAMTANLDTGLDAKFEAALEALGPSDLVIMHVKGADIAAHDRRPELKVEFLERLDKHLGQFIADHEGPLRIAVGSDHATLSESGQHTADPVPVLIWGRGIEADEVTAFDEQSVSSGDLQRFPLQLLLGRLYHLN